MMPWPMAGFNGAKQCILNQRSAGLFNGLNPIKTGSNAYHFSSGGYGCAGK